VFFPPVMFEKIVLKVASDKVIRDDMGIEKSHSQKKPVSILENKAKGHGFQCHLLCVW
jgi:hypothetical protein